MFAGSEVHGSTLGILGMGRIGQGIARRGAHGFGMKVIYHNRSRLSPELEAECKARYVDKDELLRTADHLVLVVPYSAASHHAIGAAELALMKPTATLINIARGGIVDDAALAVQALRERRIAAAGLDVFEGEPKVHPDLLTVPNVVLTPHIASATVPTRLAMANLAADNLIAPSWKKCAAPWMKSCTPRWSSAWASRSSWSATGWSRCTRAWARCRRWRAAWAT
jgi:gluconate 2-dehydrogenase